MPEKGGERGIGLVDKRVEGWGQLPYGQQYLVHAQGVEGILEVQLDNLMMVI